MRLKKQQAAVLPGMALKAKARLLRRISVRAPTGCAGPSERSIGWISRHRPLKYPAERVWWTKDTAGRNPGDGTQPAICAYPAGSNIA